MSCGSYALSILIERRHTISHVILGGHYSIYTLTGMVPILYPTSRSTQTGRSQYSSLLECPALVHILHGIAGMVPILDLAIDTAVLAYKIILPYS